jgi:hypothetical protein
MLLSLYEKTYLNIGFIVAILLYILYYLLNLYKKESVSISLILINLFIIYLFIYGSRMLTNFILYYN